MHSLNVAVRRNLAKSSTSNFLFKKSSSESFLKVIFFKMSSLHANLVTLADPKAVYKLKIREREMINHDTVRFVIDLPSSDHVLGCKSGQHFYVIETIDGESVWRKYTPLDLEDHRGTFETVVKVYRANHHKDYPKGGVMTQFMETLKVGDFISIQGPIGRCTYLHNGDFELRADKKAPKFTKHVKNLGLIAGGSGKSLLFSKVKSIISLILFFSN